MIAGGWGKGHYSSFAATSMKTLFDSKTTPELDVGEKN